MARGNNLHVIMGYESTPNAVDNYFTATIAPFAKLHPAPSDDATIIKILDEETRVDVCVSSTHLTSLPEWILAVVPAYGLVWVRSCFVKRIDARPAGTAFLTSLSVQDLEFSADQPSRCGYRSPLMATLVETLGLTLEALDLTGRRGADLMKTLRILRTACPRLRKLTLGDSESLNPLHGYELPRTLEILHFTFTKRPLVFAGCALVNLRSLREVAITPYDDYNTDRSDLTDSPPTDSGLEHFIIPLL